MLSTVPKTEYSAVWVNLPFLEFCLFTSTSPPFPWLNSFFISPLPFVNKEHRIRNTGCSLRKMACDAHSDRSARSNRNERERNRVCQRRIDSERDRDICNTIEVCDFYSTNAAALKHVNEATAFCQVLFIKKSSFCTR